MPRFNYIALDSLVRKSTGVIEAPRRTTRSASSVNSVIPDERRRGRQAKLPPKATKAVAKQAKTVQCAEGQGGQIVLFQRTR